MKRTKSIYLALLAVLLSPMAANANLIPGVTGTGGTVIDTVNNQEWLRLDVTTGLTIADALLLSAPDGFAWATENELNILLDQFFGIYGGDPGSRAGDYVFGDPTSVGAEAQWNILFGLTFDSVGFRESLGFYDDGGGGGGGESWYGFNSNPATFNSVLTPPVFDIGVFLVRGVTSVPEPGTLALLGLGLVGMAARRRKKV